MRLRNLKIQGFRRFERFELKNLGRVNLLVGTNNCGKTTVLEAVQIMMANGDFSAIWSTLVRRGEDHYGERESVAVNSMRQVDVRWLFRGHEIEVGKTFELSSDTDLGPRSIIAKVEFRPVQEPLFELESQQVDSSEDFLPPLSLSLAWSQGPIQEINVPINRRGGISSDVIRRNIGRSTPGDFDPPIRFITTSSLTAETVSVLFEEIVLTPEEDLVIEAMRIIEPAIERIASAGSEKFGSGVRRTSRGGIFVRLKGIKDRVPIGSMGDGIWRMLGMALAVVQSRNGILLVDEIDTGLHYTVMQDMWKFLYSCAKRYNVQIIATTHSGDCFQSLAAICRDDVAEGSDVTINRIENGHEEAIEYTEQEIVAAADRGIEVR